MAGAFRSLVSKQPFAKQALAVTRQITDNRHFPPLRDQHIHRMYVLPLLFIGC